MLPAEGDCEKSLIVPQSDSCFRLEPLNQREMSSKYLGNRPRIERQPIHIIFSQDGLWWKMVPFLCQLRNDIWLLHLLVGWFVGWLIEPEKQGSLTQVLESLTQVRPKNWKIVTPVVLVTATWIQEMLAHLKNLLCLKFLHMAKYFFHRCLYQISSMPNPSCRFTKILGSTFRFTLLAAKLAPPPT